MKDLVVRAAFLEDAPALIPLAAQLGYPCREDRVRERLAAILASDSATVLVAEAGGRVVAWTSVEIVDHFYVDPVAEISGFVVDEGHRSRGIGAALMRGAESWAKNHGMEKLRLRANAIRLDAHRFYEREGFSRSKTQVVFVKPLAGT